MKRKLLRCMTAVATMWLATSCSSELALEGAPQTGVDGEEVEVTFSISPESANAVMRDATDDGGPGRYQSTIGKGKKIDMLIYAVYEVNKDVDGNVTYGLLKQYGKDIPSKFINTKAIGKRSEDERDYLQTGQAFESITVEDPAVITLRLMRNQEYRIAFWAQSSDTEAFNTVDLKDVKVDYSKAQNNDELRDAFCKVESFSVGSNSTTRTVVLTRPFAQINVGTTGADYKNYLEGEYTFPNRTITMSKIALKGVANTINVVEDKISGVENDAVTFDWAPLAAYLGDVNKIPSTKEELINGTDDEFLKVKLNYMEEGGVRDYRTIYPTIDTDGTFLTETFKYLSMCYALVPAAKNPDIKDDTDGTGDAYYDLNDLYTSSVLEKVEVSFAEQGKTDEGYVYVSLENVPVHRNWRTNILGGLNKGNGPDDPSSIFSLTNVVVERDPSYDGEHNTEYGSYTWTSTMFPKDSDDNGNDDEDGEGDDSDDTSSTEGTNE